MVRIILSGEVVLTWIHVACTVETLLKDTLK